MTAAEPSRVLLNMCARVVCNLMFFFCMQKEKGAGWNDSIASLGRVKFKLPACMITAKLHEEEWKSSRYRCLLEIQIALLTMCDEDDDEVLVFECGASLAASAFPNFEEIRRSGKLCDVVLVAGTLRSVLDFHSLTVNGCDFYAA
ncbi:unnamed protein product [Gongylonema pulchrum]|uniref:Uncharacterized protein n=1 Tax=Gongylonema pulchrum TaxID=637853 RepID=A0A183EEZ1_9BILA|nr:unnamed protein product [Gongylonema pulchrum]